MRSPRYYLEHKPNTQFPWLVRDRGARHAIVNKLKTRNEGRAAARALNSGIQVRGPAMEEEPQEVQI